LVVTLIQLTRLPQLPRIRAASRLGAVAPYPQLKERTNYVIQTTTSDPRTAQGNDLQRCSTKEHLEALAKMIGTVLHRHFIVLERLGYDPDNPPPDAKLN
jgi:hypothetical protein